MRSKRGGSQKTKTNTKTRKTIMQSIFGSNSNKNSSNNLPYVSPKQHKKEVNALKAKVSKLEAELRGCKIHKNMQIFNAIKPSTRRHVRAYGKKKSKKKK